MTDEDFTGVPKFRLFSIDGGHTAVTTLNDLCVVQQIICDGAVVTLDDYSNPLWPGVYTAYAKYALDEGTPRLVPFYWGHNKIWLTTPSHHSFYFNALQSIAPSTARDKLFGWDVRQGPVK